MKNIICLIAFIGFFIAGMHSANAQWEVNVEWDDSECNCGTITGKSVFITIVYLSDPIPPIVDNEEFDVLNATNPYPATGDETINMDCEDCYYVYARVYYYDSSGECCTGYGSATVDGQQLIDGYDLPEITMD